MGQKLSELRIAKEEGEGHGHFGQRTSEEDHSREDRHQETALAHHHPAHRAPRVQRRTVSRERKAGRRPNVSVWRYRRAEHAAPAAPSFCGGFKTAVRTL